MEAARPDRFGLRFDRPRLIVGQRSDWMRKFRDAARILLKIARYHIDNKRDNVKPRKLGDAHRIGSGSHVPSCTEIVGLGSTLRNVRFTGMGQVDEEQCRMPTTRLILIIGSVIFAAVLPHSSSSRDGPDTHAGSPYQVFSLDRPVAQSADLSNNALMPLSEEEARAANVDIPVAPGPLEVAMPMTLSLEDKGFLGRASATDCLTAAIYYEAATESVTGKRAVAQVILNRVRHPAFPNSVCEVVLQGAKRSSGCQFTFTCDGSLSRKPSAQGWQTARQVALAAMSGVVEPSVGMATHYHANYVLPYWASSLNKVAAIGTHIFYRWSGNWGLRRAFNQSLALDREFGSRNSVQWRLAAGYMHDLSVQQDDDTADDFATQPQPLPAQADAPSGLRSSQSLPTPTATLLADQKNGRILADEQSGTLNPH